MDRGKAFAFHTIHDYIVIVDTRLENLANKQRAARSARLASRALRERMQDRLFEGVADECLARDVPEPGAYLARVMAGEDPRTGMSRVGHILDTIRARGPGSDYPTEEEWIELADLLDRSPAIRREYVDLNMSVQAAKHLLPYLYASRRNESEVVENRTGPEIVPPLTREEIELFAEYWDEQY